MKLALFLFCCTLNAGCTQSKPRSTATPTQVVYVQPVQPIHKSISRVQATSASFSESEEFPFTLRTAIAAINHNYRPREEGKSNARPARIQRRETPELFIG